MSVDTVNQALTCVRHNLQCNWASFSEAGFHKMMNILDVQRAMLMEEDAQGFIRYTQERLGADPDAVGFILEQLFEQLLGNPHATWEQFEQELVTG